MREFLRERSEHKVSRYELPLPLRRRVVERLKPYIDRFAYGDAVEAALASGTAKSPVREREPS
jgi:hypothetical protein